MLVDGQPVANMTASQPLAVPQPPAPPSTDIGSPSACDDVCLSLAGKRTSSAFAVASAGSSADASTASVAGIAAAASTDPLTIAPSGPGTDTGTDAGTDAGTGTHTDTKALKCVKGGPATVTATATGNIHPHCCTATSADPSKPIIAAEPSEKSGGKRVFASRVLHVAVYAEGFEHVIYRIKVNRGEPPQHGTTRLL